MTDFSTLGLSAIMLKSLDRLKFSSATPIQAAAIPAALAGEDILGTAQTGTGKTAAFGLPLIEHIAAAPRDRTALVITPTRELATQVQRALESFIDRKQKIRTALIIGGEPYFRQRQALALNPAILIGTPGRLNDHLNQGTLDLSGVTFLVLDETDRMLDMGFSVQIDSLLAGMDGSADDGAQVAEGQKTRQTLLFSATLPSKIEKLAKTYMTAPQRISVGQQSSPATQVTQSTEFVNQGEKFATMTQILDQVSGTAVVFVRTKYGTERVAKALSKEGYAAEALHGDLRQRKRDNVVQAFRKRKFRVLVATDVAARGLDIPHIELVINHDLPQVAEDYIHRIGRTARAGASGQAISFVSPAEKNLWSAITRMLNPKAKNLEDREPRQGKGGPAKGRGQGKPKSRPKSKGKPWSPMPPDQAPGDRKPKKGKPYSSRDRQQDRGQGKPAAKRQGFWPKDRPSRKNPDDWGESNQGTGPKDAAKDSGKQSRKDKGENRPKNRQQSRNKDKGKPKWAGKRQGPPRD